MICSGSFSVRTHAVNTQTESNAETSMNHPLLPTSIDDQEDPDETCEDMKQASEHSSPEESELTSSTVNKCSEKVEDTSKNQQDKKASSGKIWEEPKRTLQQSIQTPHSSDQQTSSVNDYSTNVEDIGQSAVNKDSKPEKPHSSPQSLDQIPHTNRLAYIRRKCDDIKTGKLIAPDIRHDPVKRMLINDNKKIFYCQISKNACTLWTSLLEDANLNYQPMKSKFYYIIHTKRMDEANISVRQSYDDNKFKDYTKFIVVRHPLDRVLSAYYNIIDRKSSLGPSLKPIKAILSMHNTSIQELTLSQFVEFLTLSNYPKQLNPLLFDKHWDTYYNLCDVCSIEYDYVVYFEDMAVDGKHVLRALGWPEDHVTRAPKINQRTIRGQQSGPYSVRFPEYGQLNPELLAKLLKLYEVDMELFGYTFDVDTMTASLDLSRFKV